MGSEMCIRDSGEGDAGGNADEVAGGLAGGGVVGEGRGGLGDDGAAEGGVGIGVAVEDLVFRTGVELVDDSLSEGKFRVEGLGARGEDRDGEGSDVDRQMRGGTDGVVAAACEEEQKPGGEEAEAHGLLSHCGRLWGMCKIGAGSRLADALKMRVLEEGWVFEAVAEGAVEGDVGQPDQGDCQQGGLVLEVSNAEEG